MTDLRALLLTDVVDSTRLSERLGDRAMAEVWSAHDRVARGLLPRWRGREIDETEGMLLLVDDAADAVQYAQACRCRCRPAPQVAFIVSSREALRVPGERASPILLLPLPGP